MNDQGIVLTESEVKTKSKNMMNTFENTYYNGNVSANPDIDDLDMKDRFHFRIREQLANEDNTKVSNKTENELKEAITEIV
jgi:hypothetical protein